MTAQKESEPISQYVTRLRTLGKTCEFHDIDDEIVDQIIEKCASRKLRKRLLKEQDLALLKLCQIATIIEAADHQAEQYTNTNQQHGESESDQDDVNKITSALKGSRFQKSKIAKQTRPSSSPQPSCFRCGNPNHLANNCEVTKGKTCRKCGKLGHFSTVCRSNSTINRNNYVRYIEGSDSSENDFVLSINSNGITNEPFPILMENKEVSVLIDSGSTVNVIDQQTLRTLPKTLQVLPYHKKIFVFNSNTPLDIDGVTWANVQYGNHCTSAKFIVVRHTKTAILGYETATTLDLLRVGPAPDVINKLNNVPNNSHLNKILSEYNDRFQGLGELKDVQLKIQTDPTVTPIAQKSRRLPILMQKQVDDELDKLLQLNVIEKVTSPPTWVSPLVIVPKKDPSKIRMCVDMRAVNTSIIREPYQIPTLEELLHEFNGCTVFTKLDLNKGYHQISLAPESRDLTTFASHRGIFRYTRLIFGISSAAELYQREIEHALEGLPCVRNISDDIIIGGRNETELLDRTAGVLKRLREKELTVNPDKCEFLKKEIIYMGHKLSASGISPDQEKVDTIMSLQPPTNVKELRSFLGMITYCSRFMPSFASITDPLRKLLKKDHKWEWSNIHQETFLRLKELLISSQTLSYYNPQAYTEIVTDASPVGLGAVIAQQQSDGTIRPISYASRSLTPVEQRYSQIEREALGILFAIERFRIYLYGLHFTVKTDHKPLVSMFSTTKSRTLPPRIERWIMRLMPYNFQVTFQPGAVNSADFLSRSRPLPVTNGKSHRLAEDYVRMTVSTQLPVSISVSEICAQQDNDNTIKLIKESIINNQPLNPSHKHYYPIRHKLSILENCLMFNDKAIIPPSLQRNIVNIAHEGHQGIVRTKQRLRAKVWWPGMGKFVEDFIGSCHGCQVTGPASKKTPVVMTEIPQGAWLLVGCDLCGPFPTGEHLLVCVDYYSRYPEVEIIHKTNTKNIADKLRKLFCRYGAPETLITDNGPQFKKQNAIFKSLMAEFGIHHRRVTPYHPAANGEVERFNRTMKKTIQAAIAENRDWRTALQNFLLSYRVTPHATTGIPPAELMFNRPIKDKLINMTRTSQQPSPQKRDREQKRKIASYANERNHAADHQIKVGDAVLVTDLTPHRNKFTSRWKQTPCTVQAVKGNAIFMQHGAKAIMRTSSQVKLYNPPYQQQRFNETRTSPKRTPDQESSSEDDFPLLPSIPLPSDQYSDEANNSSGDDVDEDDDDATIPYRGSDNANSGKEDDTISCSNDQTLFVPERRCRKRPCHLKDYVMD